MRLYQFDWFTWLIVAIAVAIVAAAIYSEISWQKYASEHHCVRTGETREYFYTQYTYDDKGNITGAIPETIVQYRYACDDDTNTWH